MEDKLEEILHRNYGTSEPNESDDSEMTGEATAEPMEPVKRRWHQRDRSYSSEDETDTERTVKLHGRAKRSEHDANDESPIVTKDNRRVWDETAKEAFYLIADVISSHLRWSLEHFETAYTSKVQRIYENIRSKCLK